MVSASLDMLEESLQKKVELLAKIEDQNEKQRDVLSDPEKVDEAAFDATVDAKSKLIDEINSLDDGFQSLFDRVKGEVGDHKELYAEQVKRMQKLISGTEFMN